MAIAVEYVANPLVTVPANANGVSINGPGVAWTSTAWSELIASTASAITLAGIVLRFATTGIEVEVDIGKGAAGSETVVGTLRFANRVSSDQSPFVLPFPLPISNIGSGQRVATRLRVSSTTVSAFRITLLYYASGSITTCTTTAKPSLTYPAAANGISLSTTSAWTYTAWTELVAATSAAIVIPALIVSPPNSTFDWEVQLGIGVAGSETVLTTVRGHVRLTNGVMGPCNHLLIPALDNVPAGSRLAVRMRKSTTFVTAFAVSALYYEKPL